MTAGKKGEEEASGSHTLPGAGVPPPGPHHHSKRPREGGWDPGDGAGDATRGRETEPGQGSSTHPAPKAPPQHRGSVLKSLVLVKPTGASSANRDRQGTLETTWADLCSRRVTWSRLPKTVLAQVLDTSMDGGSPSPGDSPCQRPGASAPPPRGRWVALAHVTLQPLGHLTQEHPHPGDTLLPRLGHGQPGARWCPLGVSMPQELQLQPASPQGAECHGEEGPCPGSHRIHGGQGVLEPPVPAGGWLLPRARGTVPIAFPCSPTCTGRAPPAPHPSLHQQLWIRPPLQSNPGWARGDRGSHRPPRAELLPGC